MVRKSSVFAGVVPLRAGALCSPGRWPEGAEACSDDRARQQAIAWRQAGARPFTNRRARNLARRDHPGIARRETDLARYIGAGSGDRASPNGEVLTKPRDSTGRTR